tara:strand:+ start:933 stop:1049 length:117 start_codon:yes stop_codon:yes gene_type:complete
MKPGFRIDLKVDFTKNSGVLLKTGKDFLETLFKIHETT